MKKSIFITLILSFLVTSQLKAQTSEDIAFDMFTSIFLVMPGGHEELLSDTDIPRSLKEDGFTLSSTKPSTMRYGLYNDKSITVKSTLTVYSNSGNKVVLNVPNLRKYKDQFEVSCIFSDLATRGSFFSYAEDYGFERDYEDATGITYCSNYWLPVAKDNDLKVCITR